MSDIAFNLRCWRNAYNHEFWSKITPPVFEAWMKKEGFTPSEPRPYACIGETITWTHPERHPVFLPVHREMTPFRWLQSTLYALNEYANDPTSSRVSRLGDALYEMLLQLHPQERP